MRFVKALTIVAVLALALTPAALACDKAADVAKADGEAKAGCAKAGCAKSGCAKSAEMAAKSKVAGDDAKVELAVKTDEPTDAQLADWAEHGCAKSTAAMITRAKTSGCAKQADLAAKAEGGCEKSKAALIAMMKEHEAEAVAAK